MDPTPTPTTPSRLHHPNPTSRPTPSSGGREDCWSEGATEALIAEWGDRYVSLNRGNLRQKDWKEVADAVNARQNGIRPRKTDIQCKNRIDTLKKKYKTEKTKPPPSTWTFFSRLDSLIGANASNNTNSSANAFKKVKLSVRKPLVPSKQELRSSVSDSTESSGDELGGFDDERAVKKKQRVEEVVEGGACRELARAILRFGEIYERVESSKQERMVELERERMEFAKEIESERMNMFVDAQLEPERRARTGEEGRRRRVGKHAPSGSAKKL